MRTPCYRYDAREIAQRHRELRRATGNDGIIFYSVKANANPDVLRTLCQLGVHMEVCSAGEIQAALAAGMSPERILFGGPGKSELEIELALESGIRLFSIESIDDLQRIDGLAGGLLVQGLLRINPAGTIQAGLSMSGAATQFGFDEESLHEALSDLRQVKHIELVGFHVFYGTQIAHEADLLQAFRQSVRAIQSVSQLLGLQPRYFNLGGGFAWPFCKNGHKRLGQEFEHEIAQLLGECREQWPGARPCFESGRYLVASSGTLYLRVLATKQSRGKYFVICDGGINVLGGMAGLGRLARMDIDVISDSIDEEVDCVIVGPLCTPLDVLGRSVRTPRLRTGDVFCIPNVGAYGSSASLNNFLLKGAAEEWLEGASDVEFQA